MIDDYILEFDESQNITVLKPPIGLFEEFHDIINRDKTQDKKQALKEFNYIWQYSNPYSYANRSGLCDKDKHEYCIKKAGLGEKYKIDELITKAIKLYESEFATSLEYKAVNTLRIAMSASIGIVNELTKYNSRLYNDLPEMDDDKREESYGVFIERQEKLNTILAGLTKDIDNLKITEDKLKKYMDKNVRVGRGNTRITNSMKSRR